MFWCNNELAGGSYPFWIKCSDNIVHGLYTSPKDIQSLRRSTTVCYENPTGGDHYRHIQWTCFQTLRSYATAGYTFSFAVSPPLYPLFAHLPLFTASYPAGHSGLLGTSFPTLIYLTLTRTRSQRYLVSHSGSPDTLHPTSFIVGSPLSMVCFQISFRTLMAATCRPDILSNTQWSPWGRRLPSLFWLLQQARVVWPSLRHNACLPQYIG